MPGDVQGLGRNETLGKLILDGKQFDARLDGSVASSSLERTIDAASTLTLTVDDPERFLQGARYYERQADLLYDDLWFRMVGVQKQGDLFTLTFEDREVSILRQQTKPRRMSRAHHTRAQFLQALVAEVPHIGFVCPELTAKQPIAPFTKSDQQTLQRNRRRGIPLTAKFTIGGGHADRTQIRNLNLALNVAESLGAGHLATMGMLFAGIGESNWRDIMQGNKVPVETFLKDPNGPWGPTSGYGGVLQGQVVHHSSNWFAHMNGPDRTIGEATSFMQGGRGYQGGGAMKISKATPSIDPGKIADTVEGAPYSGHYGHHAEAQKIIDLYGGIDNVASSDNGSGRAYVKEYEFSRGAPAGPKGEDTWACGQRLAGEVQWRWFIVAGIVYFISDIDLIASAARMTINEDTVGIESIDYDLDVSPRKPNTVTVNCRATTWAAPPGTVVVLDEAMGPASGSWIVSDIVRNDLTDEQTTVTLTTVETPKKEPASQVLLRSSIPTKDGGVQTGSDTGHSGAPSADPLNPHSLVAKAYSKAQAIDAKHYPYIYGGGHGRAGVPTTGVTGGTTIGYDCSGGVCAVLNAAGILQVSPFANGTVVDAQDLTRYGAAGKGKYMTVWAIDEGGGNGHCFMEFTLPSGTVFFEFHHTGTIGGFERSRDTTGMTARHWPGT